MMSASRYSRIKIVSVATASFVVLLMGVRLPSTFGESAKPSLSHQEEMRLGEKMYRDGILPSGEPMQAVIKKDIIVPATSFTCVSCHLRSGMGSVEGGVNTPPTNGASLYKPTTVKTALKLDVVEKPKEFFPNLDNSRQYPNDTPQTARQHEVYTDKTLAEALRNGTVPSGRVMSDVMPRYLLNDENMNLLVSYLKSLSSELSPGASASELHFATIVTEDVSTADQNAMINPLENYIHLKNVLLSKSDSTGAVKARNMYVAMAPTMRYIYQKMVPAVVPSNEYVGTKLSLSRWVLKGSPATWRAQLDEYYRKEPVFAILGGISSGEWQPVQQFCEDNGIPDLFPITDYPTISQSDWYTLYFSKGYYQEGEGAARFLNSKDEMKGKPILQIVRDTREGQALSRGFRETWQEFGNAEPVTMMLKPEETLTAASLKQMTAKMNPVAIILWDGPEALKTLEKMAAGKDRPAMVLVSSSYLGKSMFSLDQQARDFTYLTYPYGLTAAPEERLKPIVDASKSYNPETNAIPTVRVSQQSYIITVLLDMTLMQMKGNYYRDNLLDQISMIQDMDLPLYERLSFGPGQRYASKGCYIVQLSTSEKNQLIKKSTWVIN
jgi:ABC-type branched-subunit amino acid transport system substrate-binding protein